MNCHQFKEYLDRHIDGELDKNLAFGMDQHARACPLCSLVLESERKFDSMLKNHLHKKEAPFALREAVIDRLNRPPRFKYIFGYNWMRPAPLTALATFAMVLVFLGVVTVLNRPFPVFAESVNRHVDFLKGSYPLEIKTTDMDEALDWFKGKMDFAVPAPHVFLKDAKLVGARIVHLKDKKVAYFIFKKDGHFVSAYSMDLKDVNLPKVPKTYVIDKKNNKILVGSHRGYKSVICLHKADRTGCVWVIDMPDEELNEILGIREISRSPVIVRFWRTYVSNRSYTDDFYRHEQRIERYAGIDPPQGPLSSWYGRPGRPRLH